VSADCTELREPATRASDEIGDDAFHQMEEELDWIEMADGGKGESPPR